MMLGHHPSMNRNCSDEFIFHIFQVFEIGLVTLAITGTA